MKNSSKKSLQVETPSGIISVVLKSDKNNPGFVVSVGKQELVMVEHNNELEKPAIFAWNHTAEYEDPEYRQIIENPYISENDKSKHEEKEDDNLCPIEHMDKLLKDIKQAKTDIITTDMDVLDGKQLYSLAKECQSFMEVCSVVATKVLKLESESKK